MHIMGGYSMQDEMRAHANGYKNAKEMYEKNGWSDEEPLKTMKFKGRPEEVCTAYTAWVKRNTMQYPNTFNIVNTITIPMPSGATVIVTYTVG